MRHLLLLLLVACSASSAPAIGDAAAQCEPGVRYECDCGAGRAKGQALCSKGATPGGCDCQSVTPVPEEDASSPDADAAEACAPPPTSTQPPGDDCDVVAGGCSACSATTRYRCLGDTQPTPALACNGLGKDGLYTEHCCPAACVRIRRVDLDCNVPGHPYGFVCPGAIPPPADCLQLPSPGDGSSRFCCP